MLKLLRQKIVQSLWEKYHNQSTQMQLVANKLMAKGLSKLTLDHFAVIDLPGPHSGIPYLKHFFTQLGFIERGHDYLAEKQNDFMWMAETDCMHALASAALPQVVVADFRLEEMPDEVRAIVEKYSRQTNPAPLSEFEHHLTRYLAGDLQAGARVIAIVEQYFSGRDWPLPTTKEFHTVREFNELIAWVLIFGRRPNHFTLSVHLMELFTNLEAFHQFVARDVSLLLNTEGGILKGGPAVGIAQGSTLGITQTIALADGNIEIPTNFVEFVWRYPLNAAQTPRLWADYFPGFIARQANRVIESLYVPEKPFTPNSVENNNYNQAAPNN